jgi:hypothetical protein
MANDYLASKEYTKLASFVCQLILISFSVLVKLATIIFSFKTNLTDINILQHDGI